MGVSLASRTGTCEWSVSPFYGRVIRRNWDADGNLLVGAPPPPGYPDGHLRPILVEASGEQAQLEGRAIGSVIEVIVDHDAGTLSFRLDDGPEGPLLEGFPVGDTGGMFLRPVVGMRWPEDVVTIRSAEVRLSRGWPQQHDNQLRERDARGLAAARSLLVRRVTV